MTCTPRPGLRWWLSGFLVKLAEKLLGSKMKFLPETADVPTETDHKAIDDPYRTSGPIDWYEVTPGGDLMKHEIVTKVELAMSGNIDVPNQITMKTGTLTKGGSHFCAPPGDKNGYEKLPSGVKVELGDVWTCKCSKKRYWNGSLWSEFDPNPT